MSYLNIDVVSPEKDMPDSVSTTLNENLKLEVRVVVSSYSYESVLKLEDKLNAEIAFQESYFRNVPDGIADICKTVYEESLNKAKEILGNPDFITFSLPLIDLEKYIKENPFLLSKKIIIEEYPGFSLKDVKKIKQIFNNSTDNVYFKLNGNTNIINYNDCKTTYEAIDKPISIIKSLELSLFEQVMFVYDIVRNRFYKEEKKNEDSSLSRDITNVILTDNIVCLGYCRIMKYIFDGLGIPNDIAYFSPISGTSGHARSVVYIRDDKYKINGVYYFDPTWDCKAKQGDNVYRYRYKYFAMTKNEMNDVDSGIRYEKYFEDFSSNFMNDTLESLKKGINNVPAEYLHSINYMSELIYGETLINSVHLIKELNDFSNINIKKLTNKFITMCDMFDRPIPYQKIVDAFCKVRKYEYYLDPKNYYLDDRAFYCLGWFLNIKVDSFLVSLLLKKDDENFINLLKSKKTEGYAKKKEYDKEFEQVKLARVLRNVYSKKGKN